MIVIRLSNIPNMSEGVAMTSKKRGRWYVIRGWGARGKNEVSQKMLQIVCPSMPQLEWLENHVVWGAYDSLIAATSLKETAPSFLSFYWTNYILCSNSFSAHHLVLVLQRRELQDDDESICWANNNAYHHSFSCTNSVTLTEAIRPQCLWDEVYVPFHLKDHFFVNMRCVCCSNIKLWNKNKWLWWSTTAAVSKF